MSQTPSTVAGRTILVTGGTGFIGSALVKSLAARGARVRTLDDESRGSKGRLAAIASQIEVVAGDVRDYAAVSKAVRGVDCVCHLAAINGTEFFYSKPERVLEVSVKGMMHVVDACIEAGVRDLVLASSSEVYQDPPRIPTDETAPLSIPDVLNPRYSYAGGKILSELLAIHYGRKHFERTAIFRPHNAYGPDMGWEHVIPQFALRMHDLAGATPAGTLPFPLQGNGQEKRAFVHVDDLVDGIVRVVEKGEHLGIYHIGTDAEVSMEELAREVGRCFQREIAIVPGPLAKGSVLRRCPDISRMRALGYAPKVALKDGLPGTVRWYVENAGRRP